MWASPLCPQGSKGTWDRGAEEMPHACCLYRWTDTVSGCQELPHKLVEKGRQATRLPPSLEG